MTISEVDNIIFNLSGGLLPEYLCKDEVDLLINKYGVNWFEKLGYNETKFKKPTFKECKI